MLFETPRLVVRLLDADDAPMILALLNEPQFIANIGDKGVRDIEGALNYIENGPLLMQANLGFSLYCCQLKNSSETIGICGLIKREGVELVEIGFGFLAQYCGQGFGFEASQGVLEHAKTHLMLPKLQAICSQSNNASISLLTKLGFHYLRDITLALNEQPIKLYEKTL